MPVSYIAVEGQHDAALVGRLLGHGGFELVRKRSEVDPAFVRYLPKPSQEKLIGRPPDAFFWKRGDHTVAVHPVGGDSQLISAGAVVADQVDAALQSIGFLIDADDGEPGPRQNELWEAIIRKKEAPGFLFGDNPGDVHNGPPRCGVFVFPNNQDQGAIEAILESCAEVAYLDLFTKSRAFLEGIDRTQLTEIERTRLVTGSNERKSRLSVIGSVLRPAAAIQNTIRDDQWFCEATLNLDLVVTIRTFLRDLLAEQTI